MTRSKAVSGIMLVFLAVLFLSNGPALWGSETLSKFQQQEKNAEQRKKEQEKEKQAEEPEERKEEDLGDAMKKRMEEGESLFDIIGMPDVEALMPTGFEIFLLWLIPFSVIVGVILLIVMVTKRRHQRILAMIEKGLLPDAQAVNHYKATQFRWDIFLLLTGLILGFGGIGLSVFMMGYKGPDQWYMGIIPFLVGTALLVFYLIFYRKKKE